MVLGSPVEVVLFDVAGDARKGALVFAVALQAYVTIHPPRRLPARQYVHQRRLQVGDMQEIQPWKISLFLVLALR